MLKYYAGGSITIIFFIIGIFLKSSKKKEKKIKRNNIQLKNIEINEQDYFVSWGQFVPIDE